MTVSPVATPPRVRPTSVGRTRGVRRLLPPFLLLSPATVFLLISFVLAMVYLLMISLSPQGSYSPDLGHATLANYRDVLADPYFHHVLLRTARLAAYCTLCTLVCGYPVAYYISRCSPRAQVYLSMIVIAPLFISSVATTFGWYTVLGQPGPLNWLTSKVSSGQGLDLVFTLPGVVVAESDRLLPYMVFALFGSLSRQDVNLTRAARSLGASPLRTFVKVTFPISLPGVFAGAVIVFALSASSYAAPTLLGGTKNTTMAMYIYQQGVQLINWPRAGVLTFIFLVAVALAVAVLTLVLGRRRGGE